MAAGSIRDSGTGQALLPLFPPHTFAGIVIAIMSERQVGDSCPIQANDDGLEATEHSPERHSKTIQSYKPSTSTSSSTSTLGADNATTQNSAKLAHEVGPSARTTNGPAAADPEVPTAEQLKEIYHESYTSRKWREHQDEDPATEPRPRRNAVGHSSAEHMQRTETNDKSSSSSGSSVQGPVNK